MGVNIIHEDTDTQENLNKSIGAYNFSNEGLYRIFPVIKPFVAKLRCQKRLKCPAVATHHHVT